MESPLRLINDAKYVISFILCQIYQKWSFILFRYLQFTGKTSESNVAFEWDFSIYPFLFEIFAVKMAKPTEKTHTHTHTHHICLNRSICKIVFRLSIQWNNMHNQFGSRFS